MSLKRTHLKDTLQTPKDKRSHVVFGISCAEADCQETYMGETKQALKSRIQQHQRPSSGDTYDSAVYTHLHTSGHSINPKEVIILVVSRTGFAEGSGRRCTNGSSDRHRTRGEGGGGTTIHLSSTWGRALRGRPRRMSADHNKQSPVEVHVIQTQRRSSCK